MNPYEVLGVARTATADEIKRAYRSLASQHHPDKGGDTQKFQQIQSAYDTLSDPAKRAEYDQPRPSFQSFNFDFGGASPFGDVFDQMFRQHQRRSHVRMTVWISLAEVAQGGSRTVNVGTSGGTSTVQIQIPQGIEDGDNVQYGGVAPNGMDLVVQFRIHADPRWRREGLNLHTDHRVSIWDLILGSETEITTISGTKLSVKIPAGMQPGTVMRLRTHGLKNQKGAAGDLLLHLQAEIPRNIAPEIVDAIKRHR